MLVRQAIARIIPKCLGGMDLLTALIKYMIKFWLLLLTGLVLALFGLYNSKHRNERMTKGWFLALLISGSACLLYSFVLTLEAFIVPGDSITPVMASSSLFPRSSSPLACTYPTATSGKKSKSSASR